MPLQQPTPRPLGQTDAAVLSGLLAVIEGELAGKNVEPYLVNALTRRFQHEGLISTEAGPADLLGVVAQLNQRLRVAQGDPIALAVLAEELKDLEVPVEQPAEEMPVVPADPGTTTEDGPEAAAQTPEADVQAPEAAPAEMPAPSQPEETGAEDADRPAVEEPGVFGGTAARQLWRKPKSFE